MIATQDNRTMSDADALAAFNGPGVASMDTSPRAQRQRRVTAARAMLARKGLNKQSAVFLTSTDILEDNSDLEENTEKSNRPLPMVCEVLGEYAVYFLADRTHRLSTEEEIERFKREQKARDEACAAIEAKNPNNKHVHQTITYNVAPDAAKPAGIPATAGEPARPRRSAEAGEKDK